MTGISNSHSQMGMDCTDCDTFYVDSCKNHPIVFQEDAQIKNSSGMCHFVDASDEKTANWLRFINCARHEDEQNLLAFQYKGQIYYRTFRTVKANSELLVWYGDNYGTELSGYCKSVGSMRNLVLRRDTKTTYPCSKCNKVLATSQLLKYHNRSKHSASQSGKKVSVKALCMQRRFPPKPDLFQVPKKGQSSSLRRDANNNSDSDNILCPKCLKPFRHKLFLDAHFKVRHPE